MPTLTELKQDAAKRALDMQALIDDPAKPAGEKRSAYDAMKSDFEAVTKQIADEEYLAAERKGLIVPDATHAGEPYEAKDAYEGVNARTLADALITSDGYKGLAGRSNKGQFGIAPIEVKTNPVSEGSGGASIPQPDVQPGILPLLFQRLTVADLIPAGSTSSNVVRILEELAITNSAAAVAEAATKPTSDFTYTSVDEPVKKIAHITKVTDEMFEDAPQLRSVINNRMILLLGITEEAELLSGSGSGAHITGLLNRSGLTAAQAVASDTRADAIFKEITKVRVASFLDPDAIVLHPTDWQSIRLTKDSNGQYYGGGPFTGAYGNGSPAGYFVDTLWGTRVVVTTAMTQGTALIGAFGTASQRFMRSGVTIEATNTNEDDFIKNKVTIRCELREALAVYRPAAFGTVTGL